MARKSWRSTRGTPRDSKGHQQPINMVASLWYRRYLNHKIANGWNGCFRLRDIKVDCVTLIYQFWSQRSLWHQNWMCSAPCREVFQRIRVVSSFLSVVQGRTCAVKRHRNSLYPVDFGNQFPLFWVGTSAKFPQKSILTFKMRLLYQHLASHLTTLNQNGTIFSCLEVPDSLQETLQRSRRNNNTHTQWNRCRCRDRDRDIDRDWM